MLSLDTGGYRLLRHTLFSHHMFYVLSPKIASPLFRDPSLDSGGVRRKVGWTGSFFLYGVAKRARSAIAWLVGFVFSVKLMSAFPHLLPSVSSAFHEARGFVTGHALLVCNAVLISRGQLVRPLPEGGGPGCSFLFLELEEQA